MPAVLREYDSIIQDQLEKGIVEAVPPADNTSSHTHYLPRHAVVHRDKSRTKLCVLHDALAKADSKPSLNDCLNTGPKFNQRILDILLKFQSFPEDLTADIENAFLMVAITENDQDALQFLWVDDIMKESPETCILRFTRVAFGVL